MFDSWDFYQEVNRPLFESEMAKDCTANQLMIDLGLDASDLLIVRLLIVSMSQNRRNSLMNRCHRLSRSYTILATSPTMLVTTRTEILRSYYRMYRS